MEGTYQMPVSAVEKRQIALVQQFNCHGSGGFKVVLLEVVEHVFQQGVVIQRQGA